MAAVAVEPVVAAIIEIITAAVEKGTEAAVVASISAAVTEAVEVAVSAAISAAIASAITSAVSGKITEMTTRLVEDALQKNIDQAVKDVIGSQGVHDISQAITAIPSDEAVNKLAKAAFEAVNPHLWVFTDPAYFRLTRLTRALRAVKKGKKPEDDDDDDDCDEEKCRYFDGPEVEDDAEDFLFFSVFESGDCKEGEEVYSMFAQWKKLVAMVEDPIGGHVVTQLFQEVFQSCVDDEEDSSLGVGITILTKKITDKLVKVSYGTIVYFGNEIVYNIKGSSVDKRKRNWLKAYFKLGYGKCSKCYIASENPPCGHTVPLKGNIVGGHMWSPALKKADKSLYYYILPICKRHNKHNVYDDPSQGWLKTTADAMAMKITSTSKVPGWKGKLSKLIGSKLLLMTLTDIDGEAAHIGGKAANIGGEAAHIDGEAGEFHKIVQPKELTNWLLGEATDIDGEPGECHTITQPKDLTDWLSEEVHKIALEFAKDAIETVFKEVAATVLGKLNEIIKKAGEDAENWAKSEGHDIMLKSLIPFYGMYQAIKRLKSLKSDAIGRFHSGAQSALANYKNECLGDAEQARRKQRLSEETDKVIASQKWKDRIGAFEKTVASTVPTLVKP